MTVAEIENLLSSYVFHFSNEAELQEGIEALFKENSIPYLREYPLPPNGRVDFYIKKLRLGIEVKIKGSPSAVTMQVYGYVKNPQIDSIILLTSKLALKLPGIVNGKVVVTIPLWANGL